MSILAVDEVMLREPRLLVPRMQPLGPVKVDSTHPLTSGLLRCFLGRRQNFSEVLYSETPTIVGTPAVGITANGAAWQLTNANYLTYNDDYRSRITTGLTVFFFGFVPSLALTGGLITNGPLTASSRNWSMLNTSGPKLGFSVTTGAAVNAVAATNSVVGLHALVGTYDGVNVSFYEDARAVVQAAQTGNVATGDYVTGLSRHNFGGVSINLLLAGISARCWSDAEVRAWQANPYQFLMPA